jgi:hypothetical protein
MNLKGYKPQDNWTSDFSSKASMLNYIKTDKENKLIFTLELTLEVAAATLHLLFSQSALILNLRNELPLLCVNVDPLQQPGFCQSHERFDLWQTGA